MDNDNENKPRSRWHWFCRKLFACLGWGYGFTKPKRNGHIEDIPHHSGKFTHKHKPVAERTLLNELPEDRAERVECLRKSAETGNADWQCQLGLCYLEGDGVPEDKVEAVNWFRKSAEQGYAIAQYNLACCYFYGDGVLRNKTEAIRWLCMAANQGLDAATDALNSE